MKRLKRLGLTLVLLLFVAGGASADQAEEKLYYGVETNGKLCGYSETTISSTEIDGSEAIRIEENITVKLSAMGADFDTKIDFLFYIDPVSGNYFYQEYNVDQGTMKLAGRVDIDGDIARITSGDGGEVNEITLTPDVILDNTQIFFHILRDFVDKGISEKVYKSLDVMEGAIHEMKYTKAGTEQIELAGKTYDAIVLDCINFASGAKMKWWMDSKTGYALKGVFPSRTIFLADESIKDKIGTASIDDNLFAKVDASIADIKSISYMKVRTTLEPGGGWVTVDSLNIPGQKFEGTVEENLIDGVFEITHKKYDGSNPPPFPPDFRGDEELHEYLNPSKLIESDYQPLVDKARELTEGSENSWEAMKRLSRWVDDEITYDIPGGTTAQNTFDTRLGECGSHSRLLTAMCRAVGIPARVVWGCMYVPNHGGAFGQHGWNEVYMGEAGWLPIDATAEEIDYADCGHIRLGVLGGKGINLNFKSAEMLDYMVGDKTMAELKEAGIPDHYKQYIGEYQGPQNPFKVLVQNGSLAVDVPGKMIFELNDPDENGVWGFKVSDNAGISFEKDESGKIVEMTLNSKAKLPRKTGEEPADETDVPDPFIPYLGGYAVPMQNLVLTVLYNDDNLAVDDPKRGLISFTGPDDRGRWTDQWDQNQISFDLNDQGKAMAMIFHNIIKMPRIE